MPEFAKDNSKRTKLKQRARVITYRILRRVETYRAFRPVTVRRNSCDRTKKRKFGKGMGLSWLGKEEDEIDLQIQ